MVKYCTLCETCQRVGKLDQLVPPALLHPISMMGEPSEKVIVDCVGPLFKTKTGNQFLFTVMCTATRFPEAILLHRITAQMVVKALTKFFYYFWPPKSHPN